MRRFLDLQFWFGTFPAPLSKQTMIIMAVILGLMLVGSIVLIVLERKQKGIEKPQKHLYKKLETLLITMSLFGFAWIALTYEEVRLFSMRFWMIVWIAVLLYWGYKVFHYAQRVMPAALAKLSLQKTRVVYSPSNKKWK